MLLPGLKWFFVSNIHFLEVVGKRGGGYTEYEKQGSN